MTSTWFTIVRHPFAEKKYHCNFYNCIEITLSPPNYKNKLLLAILFKTFNNTVILKIWDHTKSGPFSKKRSFFEVWRFLTIIIISMIKSIRVQGVFHRFVVIKTLQAGCCCTGRAFTSTKYIQASWFLECVLPASCFYHQYQKSQVLVSSLGAAGGFRRAISPR